MRNVAVLGYGVVGSGVVEVLETSKDKISRKAGDEIRVRKILDIREYPDDPYRDLIVHDYELIYNDPSIDIVVETIGGIDVAYDFSKKALSQGRHLITSNKELFAEHGPELQLLAKEKRCRYMYEASVGGGIPIIRPMMQCLAANDITSVIGILNGTTNYILTQMKLNNKGFGQALKEAQAKGYAEANSDNDIEGYDTCRKIAILSGLAFEKFIDYKDIKVEGITSISNRDFLYAEELGYSIKLIGLSRKYNGCSTDCIEAIVCPMLVPFHSPLHVVEDVMNAILVTGSAVGDAMFYGRGAGKLPTASAIVADIIDVVRNPLSFAQVLSKENKGCIVDAMNCSYKYFARVNVDDKDKVTAEICNYFANPKIIRLQKKNRIDNEIAFITDYMTEKEFYKSCEVFEQAVGSNESAIANFLRFIK